MLKVVLDHLFEPAVVQAQPVEGASMPDFSILNPHADSGVAANAPAAPIPEPEQVPSSDEEDEEEMRVCDLVPTRRQDSSASTSTSATTVVAAGSSSSSASPVELEPSTQQSHSRIAEVPTNSVVEVARVLEPEVQAALLPSLCSSLRENLGLIPPPVKTDASERLMIFQACEFLGVAKEGTLEACARACLAALVQRKGVCICI